MKSRDFDDLTIKFLTEYHLYGESALDIGARYIPKYGAGLLKGLERFGVKDYTILEIYPPNVKELRKRGYNAISGDVRLINYIFPINSFDVVCWIHGIEHLNNFAEIHQTIRKLCRVTRKFLLLSFPIGKEKQGPLGGNPYEVHRYFIMSIGKILSCFERGDIVHSIVYPRPPHLVGKQKVKFYPNAVVLYRKR